MNSEKKDIEKAKRVTAPIPHSSTYNILIAEPPLQVTFSEEQVEVSNGPAFKCLDDNFQQGLLTGTEIAQLKASYIELFDHLKKSRESEFNLINHSKQNSVLLEQQENQLARETEFPDNIINEVGQLRQHYLQAYNRLNETEERLEELRYFCDSLIVEKQMLQRDFTAMPKSELDKLGADVDIVKEMEKRLNSLRQTNKEIKVEIEVQQRETKRLKDNLQTEQDQIANAQLANDEIKHEIDSLKAELQGIVNVPAQFSKETEKLRRKKTEFQKEQFTLDEECAVLRKQVERLEMKKMAIESETAELNRQIAKDQQNLFLLQKNYDDIVIKIEVGKQKELEFLADKAQYDLSCRQLTNQKKNLHDDVIRLTREKESLLRSLKKDELLLKIANENLISAKLIHEKVRASYELFPKDDNSLFHRITHLQNEANNLKRQIEEEVAMSHSDEQKISHMQQSSERLFSILNNLRTKVIQLTRVAANKAEQRELMSRDFVRAKILFQKNSEDVKVKNEQIVEEKKRLVDVTSKLNDFAKLYDMVKTDRNKAVHLLQTTTQRVAELREKIRLHSNEAEITRTHLIGKEKRIQKERMRLADAVVHRDGRRYEYCKRLATEAEQRLKRDQLKLNIQRLNTMVNQTEEDMVNLKKISDRTVSVRNENAIHLIEKNEEVYILQEKTKIQETMMRNGEVEAQSRQEEINFLCRQMLGESRTLELLKKKIPVKNSLVSKYKELDKKNSKCRKQLALLERRAENPNTPGRLRFLGGSDPAPLDLQKKLEQLESRLTLKEEEMLEKDLVYEAVSRLVDQIQRRSMNGRDDTLKLAKTVNRYKSQLITITKKMKAVTAEMTIYMTEAKELKLQVQIKQRLVDNYTLQMNIGRPPNSMVEEQWKAIETREKKSVFKKLKLHTNNAAATITGPAHFEEIFWTSDPQRALDLTSHNHMVSPSSSGPTSFSIGHTPLPGCSPLLATTSMTLVEGPPQDNLDPGDDEKGGDTRKKGSNAMAAVDIKFIEN